MACGECLCYKKNATGTTRLYSTKRDLCRCLSSGRAGNPVCMAFAASAPRIFDDKAKARVVWALCAVFPIRARRRLLLCRLRRSSWTTGLRPTGFQGVECDVTSSALGRARRRSIWLCPACHRRRPPHPSVMSWARWSRTVSRRRERRLLVMHQRRHAVSEPQAAAP